MANSAKLKHIETSSFAIYPLLFACIKGVKTWMFSSLACTARSNQSEDAMTIGAIASDDAELFSFRLEHCLES